jgi:hypothetical protein
MGSSVYVGIVNMTLKRENCSSICLAGTHQMTAKVLHEQSPNVPLMAFNSAFRLNFIQGDFAAARQLEPIHVA